MLVTWLALPRIRAARSPEERGRWVGRMWGRVRGLAELLVGADDWRLEHSFDLALHAWYAAAADEGAGQLVDAVCPLPLRGPRTALPDGPFVARGEAACRWAQVRIEARELAPERVFHQHPQAWWDGVRQTAPDLVPRARPATRGGPHRQAA